jgi:H+/Cl- antiporter ClcA
MLPHRFSKRGAEKRKAWRRSVRLRQFRYVSLSREVWRRRMVFLAGAVAVGVTAVGFAKCADWAQDAYRSLTGAWPLLPLVMTPLGFAVLAYITRRWFPAAAGSGIPQVIAARKSSEERHRLCLLGFPVMIAKMVMTTAALVIGASVGREGPTVQVGASVMFAVAGMAGIGRHNGLVLAGSGAGIAAAFNAPLAGIVFAIEELAKAFTGRINEIIIGSVVIGGAVSWSILGNYPYFGEVSAHLGSSLDWLAVPVCAVLGGVLGGLFSRTMAGIMRTPPRLIAILRRRPMLFGALCGLAVGGLSIETFGYAAGSGYGETRAGLEQGALIPWWFGFAKLLSTLLSSVSGVPGGLFSPSLAVGAGMGSMAAHIFTFFDARVLMLLMMAAYFSGVVQSPLTATVIVMEMTSDRGMVIPLMATALFAASISRLISREPLYHALARNFSPYVFSGRRWQPPAQTKEP